MRLTIILLINVLYKLACPFHKCFWCNSSVFSHSDDSAKRWTNSPICMHPLAFKQNKQRTVTADSIKTSEDNRVLTFFGWGYLIRTLSLYTNNFWWHKYIREAGFIKVPQVGSWIHNHESSCQLFVIDEQFCITVLLQPIARAVDNPSGLWRASSLCQRIKPLEPKFSCHTCVYGTYTITIMLLCILVSNFPDV